MIAPQAALAFLALYANKVGATSDEANAVLHALHNRGWSPEATAQALGDVALRFPSRDAGFIRALLAVDAIFSGFEPDAVNGATVWVLPGETAPEDKQRVARVGALTFFR